ncbi:MAG: helix-turn-helix domain-containing protein, partial [Rhodospirillales bacterium]|nr:helix-turn-helix domain-containing protein [Rhodospirillales bacterium]
MLRHNDIWTAIDRLAKERGLTASALARRAGLDPTTFNRSKRVSREGKPRWPSTESISKILEATGTPFADFVRFLGMSDRKVPHHLPLVALSAAGSEDFFDARGRPQGEAWDAIPF